MHVVPWAVELVRNVGWCWNNYCTISRFFNCKCKHRSRHVTLSRENKDVMCAILIMGGCLSPYLQSQGWPPWVCEVG